MILEKKDLDMQLNNKPFLSIYMITYNHEDFIGNAIESVLMQKTTFNYKLFIGEDCSTDNTRKICEYFKNKYPEKIELFLNDCNIGAFQNARQIYNACFHSGAKYIAMLEGDDYWTDAYKLQKQVDFLEANPLHTGVFHNVVFKYQDENTESLYIDKATGSKSFNFKEIVYLNPIHTSSFIFRNNLLNFEINQFKGVGDRPLFTLISNLGPIQYLDFVGSCYRINNFSFWTPLNSNFQFLLVIKSYQNIFKYLKFENRNIVKNKIAGFYFNMSLDTKNSTMNRLKFTLYSFCWTRKKKYLIYFFKILIIKAIKLPI